MIVALTSITQAAIHFEDMMKHDVSTLTIIFRVLICARTHTHTHAHTRTHTHTHTHWFDD